MEVLVDVLEEELVVDVGGCALGPQNCTFETSGVFPSPTCGKPEFEKVPLNCGGVIEV